MNSKSVADNDVVFIVMYDISDGGTRTQVVKHLTQMGCLRIQKSVFMGNLPESKLKEIVESLKGVKDAYDNDDSYIIIPLRKESIDNMQVIGDSWNINIILRRGSVLFL